MKAHRRPPGWHKPATAPMSNQRSEPPTSRGWLGLLDEQIGFSYARTIPPGTSGHHGVWPAPCPQALPLFGSSTGWAISLISGIARGRGGPGSPRFGLTNYRHGIRFRTSRPHGENYASPTGLYHKSGHALVQGLHPLPPGRVRGDAHGRTQRVLPLGWYPNSKSEIQSDIEVYTAGVKPLPAGTKVFGGPRPTPAGPFPANWPPGCSTSTPR